MVAVLALLNFLCGAAARLIVAPDSREIAVPNYGLRDPHLLLEADAQLHLNYVGAGEQGIGVAMLE